MENKSKLMNQVFQASGWMGLSLGLAVLMLSGSLALAQITQGTISGVVQDATGGILPGVTVTITNLDTGIARTVITNDSGRYRAPSLSGGTYQVRAELAGFQARVQRGIQITVGRTAVVDLVLQVGEVTDEVIVTDEAPLVNTTGAAISGLVEEAQIRNLPLNLRSYEQLAALERGVQVHSTSTGVRGGSGSRLNIGGARAEFNTFQIDSVEVSDMWRKTPGGVSGGVMGVESIKEFSVATSNYSAEHSLSAGGVINAVTRSGTNQIEGSVYAYHRNDNLDAANFFDNRNGIKKPEFKRNQFGAAFGAPIIRDKTFIFSNYEGFRQRRASTSTSTVPLKDPSDPNSVIFTDNGITITANPSAAPYLALWPLPNGPDHGDGTADFFWTNNREVDTDYVLVKMDHQLNDTHSLSGRFIWEEGEIRSARLLPQQTGIVESKKRNLMLSQQSILTPNLINEFRFGFNRQFQSDFDLIEGIDESLNFVPLEGRVLGNLAPGGVSSIGHGSSNGIWFWTTNFQWLDNMVYTKGAHSLKWGVDIRRFQINGANTSRLHGRYRFDEFEDFLTGAPTRDFQFIVPGQGRDGPFYIRQSMFGFYLQDQYQASSNLTLNLGLRYEFITVPTETRGRIATLPDIVNAVRTTEGGPLFENPSLKNFGPRFGFAWDPFSSGQTSVRGGFGIFFDQIVGSYLHNTVFRVPPFFVRIRLNDTAFPDEFQQKFADVEDFETVDVYDFGSENFDVQFIDFRPSNPYVMHYNLEVQQEVLPGTVLTAAYVGSRGVHLGRLADPNTPVPVLVDGRWTYPDDTRRNPNFATFQMTNFDANSVYNSLQLSLRRRFTGGYSLQGSYTWSHSLDDASGVITGADSFAGSSATMASRIWDDRSADHASSGFDIPHNFSLNFLWELPVGPGKAFGDSLSGVAEALLANWQVNGILKLRGGFPGTMSNRRNRSGNLSSKSADRPDLIPGADNNPITERNVDEYISSDSFVAAPRGTHGNLGRMTIRLPGLNTFDFSLFKTVAAGEGTDVQFRAEFFNFFNRVNLGTPSLTFDSSTFGRITSARSARQIQFGLKVTF